MKDNDESESSASENVSDASRRRFLRNSVAAGAGALVFPAGGAVADALAATVSTAPPRGKRPNFLILMCDEDRFPPSYESRQTQAFRQTYLSTQNLLRRNGVDFQRHYAASVACSPSRTSIYTGQYPSLHGVSQTTGAAKESFDPDMFWLDPNSVPTLGDYFRAAGYATYWRGKWHASDADMLVPATHTQLLSYNAKNGAPDIAAEALYSNADRLDRFGFSGWIGPEPHGKSPLNSGSSVPPGEQGRDIGFARQTRDLIQQLDRDSSTDPWFIMASFVNPHDITLWGLWVNTLGRAAGEFYFPVEPYVPVVLFDPVRFNQTQRDDLSTKPSAQASYQESYGKWMQPILSDPVTLEKYFRYYYQLQKNVDDQMMTVFQALLASRFADNTIVLFTSDHGDLLGSHSNMHQKWYTAYDEAIRVPLIIYSPTLFPNPRSVDSLTSHVDLLPTLLGLAGIDPEPIRQQLAKDHSDALPLVGRNLAPLVLGEVSPASVDDPLYFMTDDDPSRGLNQDNWTGIGYNSVLQPNHLETVIARLADGKVWKYTHYFDNPQFWGTPGIPPGDPSDPNSPTVEDVVLRQVAKTPEPPPYPGPDVGPQPIAYTVTVKSTPRGDEYEMYNVTDDPMELTNLFNDRKHGAQQNQLAQLLQQQRCAKRLVPQSGTVPGQPTC
ncbi:sulfatase-like hydrolase/transferase [Trinickia mobilis]|uniref:sulfatase-like hydrolase/transferase n=1 Tax=Trinickia mobilis TaxID=2816356 RepID=UPI001A8E2427|nr:sulfatase-like hydrolase/transferase [Trinickia mobilis]